MRSRVEELFEKKVGSVGEKYAPGQPLHYRLALFTSAVERLVHRPQDFSTSDAARGNLAAHLSKLDGPFLPVTFLRESFQQASRAFATDPIADEL